MGNICTCDVNAMSFCNSNPLSKRDNSNISQLQKGNGDLMKQYLNVNANDNSNSNVNRSNPIDSDSKPSMRYIESYTSFNIFFVLIKGIILIQRNYRSHLKRKHSFSNSQLNKIQNRSQSKTTLGQIQVSSTITMTNDTNLRVNIETDSIRQLPPQQQQQQKQPMPNNNQRSPKHLKTMQSLTSNYSINSQKLHNRTTNKIKGYFLRKNIKYRYKGYLNPENKKNGFGIVQWEDNSIFKAKFKNNSANGFCKYFDSTQSIFSGIYENNRPKGYGIYEENNIHYEGTWTNNELNDIGIEIWKDDKTFYRGEFINSIKEGIGFCRWEDGTIYQGEWRNNRMNGHGMIFYPDERIYLGEIKEDVINGFGEFNWPDHKKYIGQYVNEKKEGFGIFIWSFEPVLVAYAGFWYNGKQHGLGASINNDKVTYCIWKNGRKDNSFKDQWEFEKYLKKVTILNHWGLFKLNQKELIKRIANLYID